MCLSFEAQTQLIIGSYIQAFNGFEHCIARGTNYSDTVYVTSK